MEFDRIAPCELQEDCLPIWSCFCDIYEAMVRLGGMVTRNNPELDFLVGYPILGHRRNIRESVILKLHRGRCGDDAIRVLIYAI